MCHHFDSLILLKCRSDDVAINATSRVGTLRSINQGSDDLFQWGNVMFFFSYNQKEIRESSYLWCVFTDFRCPCVIMTTIFEVWFLRYKEET